MVGVPAKQIGWVGISGNTLKFDESGKTEDEFAVYESVGVGDECELRVTLKKSVGVSNKCG